MNRLFRTSKNLLITAAVLALMTAATAQARADGTPVDLHYVAVGVSKVPSLPANNQLRFAHKDAQDLAKAWEAQRGGLYRDVRGEVLTDEKAKVADILAALDRLERRAKQGDTAVVSFAGHGAFVGTRSTNWFFVAHDFNVNNLAQTTVTERTLKQRLGRLAQKGVTVILVIDTCHSGVFNADGTGIVLLTACCPKENSFEDASFENGLFTRALLEALGGKADTNNDGVITLAEIEAYVSQRVAQMQEGLNLTGANGQRVTQNPMYTRPGGVAHETPLAGGAAPPLRQDQQRWRN